MNPAAEDLTEINVIRYFYEQINQARMEAEKQQRLLQLQQQQLNYQLATALSPIFKPNVANISTPAQSNRKVTDMFPHIPEPKVIFYYGTPPKFPTPKTSPEKSSSDDEEEEIDEYKNLPAKKSKDFSLEDRSNFIGLKDADRALTPKSCKSEEGESHLPELTFQSKLAVWCGSSIYNNQPNITMGEYDRILRESHQTKVEVIDKLNKTFAVNYNYNPKKSRIRTNYSDPQVADDRTRNNVASRRSRQRKKFHTTVQQYSLDYDQDENFLLKKQEEWLKLICKNLENKIVTSPEKEDEILKIRHQCGFN